MVYGVQILAGQDTIVTMTSDSEIMVDATQDVTGQIEVMVGDTQFTMFFGPTVLERESGNRGWHPVQVEMMVPPPI